MFDFLRMLWHGASSSGTAAAATTEPAPTQNPLPHGTADTQMHDANLAPPPATPLVHKTKDTEMKDLPASNPAPQTPTINNTPRTIATPKRKRDYVSEIVREVSSAADPLPAGYIGTFRGTRFFAPNYDASPGCANGLHHLSCGHWVSSSLQCGVNCASPSSTNAPFRCPTCHDTVKDILAKLSADETAHLHALHARDAYLFAGRTIELVTRRAPSLKGNVTEAVLCGLKSNWGRACTATAGPSPLQMPTIEQIVADLEVGEEMKEKSYSNKRRKTGKKTQRFVVKSVINVKREAEFGVPVAKKRKLDRGVE